MKSKYSRVVARVGGAIIFILMAFPLFVFSQSGENTIILDTSVFTDNNIDCIGNEFPMFINNDTLYFLNPKEFKKDKYNIKVHGFDIKANKYFYFTIHIDKKDKYFKDSRIDISSLFVRGNRIYFNAFERIYVFNRNEDGDYVFDKIINNNKKFYSSDPYLLPNGNILFYKHYIAHKEDIEKSTSWHLYSLDKEEIITEIQYLDCPNPILTYFSPNEIMTYNNDNIFYSPASEYKIRIYDFDLNPVDSISLEKKHWSKIDTKKELKVLNKSIHAMERMNAFSDYLYESTSVILHLYASDNYLIVFYRNIIKGKAAYLYDIWKKDDGKWALLEEGADDSLKDEENRLLPFKKIILKDDNIIRISPRHSLKRGDYNSDGEYYKAVDKYTIENDCILAIEKLYFTR